MSWTHGNIQAKRMGSLLADDYSSASAINDAGEITGFSNTSASVVPFVWRPKSGWQRIPLLAGDNGGQGFGINKSGDVVGYSSGPNGTRAFRWTRTGGICQLGSLPGAITVERAPLTIPVRSPAHLTARLASGLSYGQKTDKSASSVPCPETLQVKLWQSIIPAQLSDTRKVRLVCTRFCGRQQPGWKISERFPAVTRAALLILMTQGCSRQFFNFIG